MKPHTVFANGINPFASQFPPPKKRTNQLSKYQRALAKQQKELK